MSKITTIIANAKDDMKEASIGKKIAIGAGVVAGIAVVSAAAVLVVKHLPKAAEVAEKASEVVPEVVENAADIAEASL